MSVRCPFCAADVALEAFPTSVVYAHSEPICAAWDRVCYVGGFSEAERQAFEALTASFEPRGNVIRGPWGS